MEQALGVATGDSTIELTVKYQCKDKHCPNYNHTCFPGGRAGHLTMLNDDLRSWNEQIKNGNANLNSCPNEVLANMIIRKQSNASKKGGGPTVASANTPAPALPQFVINFNGIPASGVGVGGFAPGQESALRSSPPAFEGNDRKNLEEYMQWLCDRNHIDPWEGGLAKAQLQQHHWGFESIRDISTDQWKSMNVADGMVYVIKKRQKQWQKTKWAEAQRALLARENEGVESVGEVGGVSLDDDL